VITRNSTLICAPIMADTVNQMLIQMNSAKTSGADLVEIRLDSLKELSAREDIQTLVKLSPLPTIFTYRCYYILFEIWKFCTMNAVISVFLVF